jgi:predicted ester cyclase
MSVDDNKAIARRWSTEGINHGNISIVDELFAPDFVNHDPLPGMAGNRDGFKRGLAMLFGAFPDLQVADDDLIAEGDRVVSRGTFRGPNRGPFAGIAPTGKPVVFQGIAIFRIVDGKVTDRWARLDTLNLMQQLGAIPAPAATVIDPRS